MRAPVFPCLDDIYCNQIATQQKNPNSEKKNSVPKASDDDQVQPQPLI